VSQPPSVPAALAVLVSTQLKDVAGNPVSAWAGAWSWQAPAIIPFAPGISAHVGLSSNSELSLATDHAGGAMLAWNESLGTGFRGVFARRWNGSAWVELGSVPRSPTGSHQDKPRILARSGGQPIMSFLEYDDSNVPYVVVAELSGESWTALGDASRCQPGLGAVSVLLMALGLDQEPIIAFSDFSNSAPDEGSVRVCRLINGNWAVIGTPLGSSAVGGPAFLSALAVDGAGNPIIMWRENGVFSITQWDGARWVPRGQTIQAGSGASMLGASLEMGRDGIPYAAWLVKAADGSTRAYLARDTFAGHLGSALIASSPQVSVGSPSLKLDELGRPVLFWAELDFNNARRVMRMKQWLGSQWGESLDVGAIPPNAGGGACTIDAQGEVLCAHPVHDGERNVASLRRLNR
jgi:hypothetical protein